MNNAFTKVLHRKSLTVQGRSGPKVPTHRFFFKLAKQKGNDLLLPKRQKKIGGHRLRFGENMPRKIP